MQFLFSLTPNKTKKKNQTFIKTLATKVLNDDLIKEIQYCIDTIRINPTLIVHETQLVVVVTQ